MKNAKMVATGLAALALGTAAAVAPAVAQNGSRFAPPAEARPDFRYDAPPVVRRDGGRDRDDSRRERHPEIRAAMENLRQAQNNLRRADRDFGGHRARALDLTDQALRECERAMQADRR